MLALSRILEFATPLGEQAEWGRYLSVALRCAPTADWPHFARPQTPVGNTGQRRADSIGKREIIECGQGNIIKAPEALFVHGVKEAERHHPIRNKNCLSYLDQRADPVIIGAGVKPYWLTQPMHVTDAPAGGATVDWAWDQDRMTVKVHRTRTPVCLGPAFPPNTPFKVSYD